MLRFSQRDQKTNPTDATAFIAGGFVRDIVVEKTVAVVFDD
jgi:hypothetical protein